ncbi:hypothetical protein BD626DRAFT_575724 [Schizophyllum amplum]|uniref:Uncharacterized protein n=1 Tax=Schizophyllum amplum TaxID=97359 RepID=A0A550BV24_9AGAR|nr:hypothetical protein BD626DRAFT_578231 [Auriculariopsis ampla]TRM56399.1 hypothetical protein BD626DRAFT_575724 [Auriculariopsis ampla]
MQQASQARLQRTHLLRQRGFNPTSISSLRDVLGRQYEPLAQIEDLRGAFLAADIAFFAAGCSTMDGQAMGRLEGHPFAVSFYSNSEWRDTRSGTIEMLQVLAKDVIALLDLVTVSSSFLATTSPLGSPYTHPTVEGTRVVFYITPQFIPELDVADRVRVLNLLQSFAETTGVKAPVHFNSIKRTAFDWRDKRERSNSIESPESVAARATRVLEYHPQDRANVYHPHPFGHRHQVPYAVVDAIGALDALQAQDLYGRAERAEAAALARAEEAKALRQRVAELEAETEHLHTQCAQKDFVITMWQEDYIFLQELEAERRNIPRSMLAPRSMPPSSTPRPPTPSSPAIFSVAVLRPTVLQDRLHLTAMSPLQGASPRQPLVYLSLIFEGTRLHGRRLLGLR